jgi:tetratricopeptide (TPR) repeat protein
MERVPQNAPAASLLGDIYYLRQEYGRAVEFYNIAIDAEATRFREIVLLGNSYYYQRDFERALRLWDRALRLEPRNKWAKKIKSNMANTKEISKKPKGRGKEKSPPKRPPSPGSSLAGDEF